jgi:Transglycosylase SLT domain
MQLLRKPTEGSRTISGLLAGTAFLMTLFAAQPAKADYAVLRSGQRLHITGWQNLGDAVRLDLVGGSVTIPAADLDRIEPEELFGESAQRDADVPYSTQIRKAAKTYGLDPALVASVIAVESNFNSRAVSRKSALGLMQLRPEWRCGMHSIQWKILTAEHTISNSFSIVMTRISHSRSLRIMPGRNA